MHKAKVKVEDMVSTGKEKAKEHAAKAEEKVEKAYAHTHQEKEIVHEKSKAKQAEAKRQLHEEKAEHRMHTPHLGTTTAPAPAGIAGATAVPAYPASTGLHPTGTKYKY